MNPRIQPAWSEAGRLRDGCVMCIIESQHQETVLKLLFFGRACIEGCGGMWGSWAMTIAQPALVLAQLYSCIIRLPGVRLVSLLTRVLMTT